MIYGKRIQLRAPEREDIPLFVKWLNDTEVRRGLARYLPISTAEEERWFAGMLDRPAVEHPLTIEVQPEGSWRLYVSYVDPADGRWQMRYEGGELRFVGPGRWEVEGGVARWRAE